MRVIRRGSPAGGAVVEFEEGHIDVVSTTVGVREKVQGTIEVAVGLSQSEIVDEHLHLLKRTEMRKRLVVARGKGHGVRIRVKGNSGTDGSYPEYTRSLQQKLGGGVPLPSASRFSRVVTQNGAFWVGKQCDLLLGQSS